MYQQFISVLVCIHGDERPEIQTILVSVNFNHRRSPDTTLDHSLCQRVFNKFL